ncbi:MAG TPA: ABC transporter permease [Puia sp.]|nr:ABC transporter permease [Puia sp.]
MLKNYIKIAFRNLLRYKVISSINLFGLMVGLTCCLLILAYILNELSYDRFNKNANRIYRVTRTFNNQDGNVSLRLSTISPPFAPYLLNDFPDIEKMTRILNNGYVAVRYKDKLFNEDVFFADENLFDVFSVKLMEGNPANALSVPFTVMLDEPMAKKYFGNEDPLNKSVRFNNQFDLKVSGVFKPFPPNSHIHPEFLIAFNTLNDSAVYGAENLRTNWGNNSFFTYLLLPDHYPVKRMISQFPAFLDRHMPHRDYNGQNPSRFTSLGLQKLTDIHLYSHTDYEAEPNGDIKRVYIFSVVALFILLIACINYMNLSTARSALRAREIGIRKVIGAKKKELILQFLGESILLCWIAIIFACVLAFFALPWLNKIANQDFSAAILVRWPVLVGLLIAPFLIGMISGVYPALFMSSFQPIKTLKGLFKTGSANISFRQVLVTAQFAISIILIIATAVVFRQLRYMQEKSLGYDKEQVIVMPYSDDVNKQYDALRSELLRNPGFKAVGRSSRVPTGRLLDDMGAYTLDGDSLRPTNTDIKYVEVDYDFVPVYGIKLLAGRNFSREYSTDTASFLINATAVGALGWKAPGNAIGRNFKYGNQRGHVVGVFNDFNFESMHQQIVPMVLLMSPARYSNFNNLSIKLSSSNIPATLAYLERIWRRMFPEAPFQFNFLDERFAKLYISEQKQGTIFVIFACIAISIACLGLFGLSAFAISQRIKEIGIRKVLGASTPSIVALLSGDFLKLIGIAALIAFPISFLVMHNWLKDFAYRIGLGWWIFIGAAALAALIALITVGAQALKAAIANPVKNLRTE